MKVKTKHRSFQKFRTKPVLHNWTQVLCPTYLSLCT